MPLRHALLAAAVALVWGVSFTVVELGLRDLPPVLFSALRFALVFAAAAFVAPPRDLRVRTVILVGLVGSTGHFGLLFCAMNAGMPAGMASLVIQLQAVFTMAFAMLVLGERVSVRQAAGAALALAGIALIAVGRGGGFPIGALLLTVAAAASWGAGNVATRHAAPQSPVSLIVWSACVPAVVLGALSLHLEGPTVIADALGSLDAGGLAALAYLAPVATVFGFSAFAWLLREHPASRVAPFALLVPVAGIAAAALVLGERPGMPELVGAVVIISGLALPDLPAVGPVRRRGTVRAATAEGG